MHCCRDLCALEVRQAPEGEGGGEGADSRRVYLSAVISSGKRDGHGTYMTERTLTNFAEDLNNSIQFKDSHRRGQGFGVSEGGEFNDGVVTGDFKLLRGMPLSDASYPDSDTFIDAIDEGIITRVSVGFSGGKHICNICEGEWFRQSCFHWPGEIYEQVDQKTGKKRQVECEVAVDDAHLVEVSAVSKGSNPDAQITEKAQRLYEAGQLPIRVQRELEGQYDMRFDGDIPQRSDSMDLQEAQKQLETVTSERDEARTQLSELEPLAECGKAAREYMTGLCVDAYKVSRGEKCTEKDVERFQKRAGTMDFDALVAELEHLRTLAPDPPKVEPGSQTSQPDNSKGESREEPKTEVRGVNPPHWGV